MKLAARAMLALILCAIAALFALPALAAAGCNPPPGTTAKTVNGGGLAACRDGTGSPCTGMLVNADGYWHACPVATPVEPIYCPSDLAVRRWSDEATGARCDSDVRGSYTGTSHILPRTLSGYPRSVRNFAPGSGGEIAYACEAGRWVERGQHCEYTTTPATTAPASKPKPRGGDARVGPATTK